MKYYVRKELGREDRFSRMVFDRLSAKVERRNSKNEERYFMDTPMIRIRNISMHVVIP